MRPNGGNNFNRRPNRNNNGGGGNFNNRNNGSGNTVRRPTQPQNLRNQIFDSHGPNGERVRGNAFQVHEKYQSLARDAEERVDQEAYGQFAEHYYRIVEAIQEMEAERSARFAPQSQPAQGQGQGQGDNGQPGSQQGNQQGGQHNNQQRGYQNQPSEGYNGEQPDLNASEPAADGEAAPQQRRGYQQQPYNQNQRDNNRDSGRDNSRDNNRDGQRRNYRDQPREHNNEQSAESAPQADGERQQYQPRQRRPLEPINQDDTDTDSSGPIFSLAGDQDDLPVAPRPARTERVRSPKVEIDSMPDSASDAAPAADVDVPAVPKRRGRPPKAESAE